MYKLLPYAFIFTFSSLIIALAFTREFKEFLSSNFSFEANKNHLPNRLEIIKSIEFSSAMAEYNYLANMYFEKFEKDLIYSKESKKIIDLYSPTPSDLGQNIGNIIPTMSQRIKDCVAMDLSFSPA